MAGTYGVRGRTFLAVVLMVFFLALPVQGEADPVYVTVTGAGLKNGHDWENAMDLTTFVIEVQNPGEEFWLAAGSYDLAQTLKPGDATSIYGGFAGVEMSVDHRDPEANETILNGGNTLRVLTVAANTTITVDGLTITGGYSASGGAVHVSSSATFKAVGCTFVGNESTDSGGAVGAYNNSIFTATGCIFEDNKVLWYAGAVYLWNNSTFTANNCAFITNKSDYDGGAVDANNSSTFTAAGCNFSGNGAKDGGAVTAYGNSTFTATDCTFESNEAEYGGAVYLQNNSIFTSAGCTFEGNEVTKHGGAVHAFNSSNFTAVNCTFGDNEAAYGGAVSAIANSTFTSANCTFSANTAETAGQAVYLHGSLGSFTAANSIFWGNDEKKQIDRDGTVNSDNIRIAYCIIRGGFDPSEGVVNNIIDKDPMLGPLADNGGPTKTMALGPGSPAIDAGTAVFTGIDIPGEDQRGVSRPRGSGYDIGAFEYEPSHGGGSGGGCSSASFAPSALLRLLPLAALLRGRR